jgi:two-component system phosphate regulon response regulator PhoB
MTTDRPKILIVEDESDIRELISLHLQREGYRVDEVADGESGLSRIGVSDSEYDLLILDWMLPGTSGIEITRKIRAKDGALRNVPILMVTARAEPADIVLGLEAGADDYVTKPFEVPVLLARVRASLRRGAMLRLKQESAGVSEPLLVAGELTMNTQTYEVSCGGEKVPLTPSEFKLLSALMKNQGKVMTRAKLIDEVQGSDVSVVDRTVDTHVFGLRKKLGACGELIETIRGVGYRVKV